MPAAGGSSRPGPARRRPGWGRDWDWGRDWRWSWGWALAAVLAVGLALRLWGIRHGLPYIYNNDESAHFVPKAIAYFKGNLHPDYFVNPPAYSYLLHAAFAIAYGGRDAASEAYAIHQTGIFTLARVLTALLGVAALAMLYAAGRRLYDARVGVVAAAVMAVGFLPVFYSKLALNDVPTLLPLAFSLYGTAGLLTRERRRDWLYAGAGLGVACATKYTGGVALLPLLVAAGFRLGSPARRRDAATGLGLAAGASLAAFFAGNPYAFFDFGSFWEGITHQQTAAGDLGKLGQRSSSGHLYYLWTLTWGLGWGVVGAALAGAALAWREDRARFLALVVPAVFFIAFMGAQGRYFGRWLIPALPFVALLAAFGAVRIWDAARRLAEAAGRGPGPRRAVAAGLALGLLGQGLVFSVHGGRVLARPDTRNLARHWLVEHVPPGSKIVLEPIAPQAYLQDPGRPHPATPVGDRWVKYPSGRSMILNDGRRVQGPPRFVNVEDYERVTRPALLRAYLGSRFCWVVVGSTQYSRALAQPERVPRAIGYYRALNRHGAPLFAALPYDRQGRVRFSFDWSFDYYPLAYERPGPEVFVYRLGGKRCGPRPPARAPRLRLDGRLKAG